MPTYDYRCQACGHELEVFQSITESPKRRCPSCGAHRLRRVIGAGAGILFKGSGFYETDYRSESYKKGAERDKKAKDGPSDAKPSSDAKGKKGGSKGAKSDD